MARDFSKVGVIGLGTMGAGIVEVFARNGFDVVAVEVDDEAVDRGRAHLEASTGRALSRGKMTAEEQKALHDRVVFTARMDEVGTAPLEGVLGRLDAHDLQALAGEDLGDAGTHGAETDHTDLGELPGHVGCSAPSGRYVFGQVSQVRRAFRDPPVPC